jgi:hypothetical protein
MPSTPARSSWIWRFEPAEASATTPGEFTSQSDAESWLGEAWRELAEQGVTAVYLMSDGEQVYGPMPLSQ